MLKKAIGIMLCLFMLTGCAAVNTFEQIEDVYAQTEQISPKEIKITLPPDAGTTVLAGETGRLYFCEGYEITIETYPSGDLEQTMKHLTGYARNDIAVIRTSEADELERYELVWTAAGDEGETVGRSVIIDDGAYHYCICLTALSVEAGSLQETWRDILRTVSV